MNINSRLARFLVALAALAMVAVLAGCGGEAGRPDLVLKVSGAASLQEAFEQYAETFEETHDADVQLQFAGSDALAAQIEQGARPGVFAAANTKLPEQLYADELLEAPKVFATNKLVIAVPKVAGKIKSIEDLAKSGVKIAAGSESVPVGTYTRKVLAELPADQRQAIEANIKSAEPDVKGVVGKVIGGAVDAGFVYATDVKAAGDKLIAVELPEELGPATEYGIAAVRGSGSEDSARKFIEGLLAPAGQAILLDHGFGVAPS